MDEEPEPLNRSMSPWLPIFKFTKRHQLWSLVPSFLLSLAGGLLQPALAITFGNFFNTLSDFAVGRITSQGLAEKSTNNIYVLLAIGAATLVIKALLFMSWLASGEAQARSVRDQSFRALLERNTEWFERSDGDIFNFLASLQIHIGEFRAGISLPLGFTALHLVQLVAAIALALYYDWRLTLVVISSLPCVAILLAALSRKVPTITANQDDALQKTIEVSTTALRHVDVIKCLNCEQIEHGKYVAMVRCQSKYSTQYTKSHAQQAGIVRFVATAIFVLGFWYGGSRVHAGLTTAGSVITTFWCCLIATKALEDLMPHIFVLEKTSTAIQALSCTLSNILAASPLVETASFIPQFCEGDIEFRNVSFSYEASSQPATLHNINLFFPAGETTFLIGQSGSGKSTISDLLLKFYRPTSGFIYIDGQDLSVLNTLWLRNNFGLLLQRSTVFNESLFQNVAFGRHGNGTVTKGEVLKSLAFASVDELTRTVALEGLLGLGGHILSGGQSQRLAIARMKIKDAPILILDEATSALDPKTKDAVMKAIHEWRHGRTTIIITHDLEQIRDDDFVYIIGQGSVLAEGFRRDLVVQIAELDKVSMSSVVHAASESNRSGHDGRTVGGIGNSAVELAKISRKHGYKNEQVSVTCKREDSDGKIPPQDRTKEQTTLHRKISRRISHNSAAVYQGFKSRHRHSMAYGASDMPVGLQHRKTHIMGPIGPHQAVIGSSIYREAQDSEMRPDVHNGDANDLNHITASNISNVNQEQEDQLLSLRKILSTVWPHLDHSSRLKLVIGGFAAILHAGAPPAFSFVLVKLFNTFYATQDYQQRALVFSLAILAIAIVDGFATFLLYALLAQSARSWVDKLRVKAFKMILTQPKAWHDRAEHRAEHLCATLDQDSEAIGTLVNQFVAPSMVAIITLTVSVFWALVACWRITLVALSTVPLLYLSTKAFSIVSTKREKSTSGINIEISRCFTDAFANVRAVRSLTLEEYFHKKYTQLSHKELVSSLRWALICGALFGVSDSAIPFVTALIFWYGSHLAATNTSAISSIFTVFALLLFGIANVNAVIAEIPQTAASHDAGSRLVQLLKKPKSDSRTTHKALTLDQGRIRSPKDSAIQFTNYTFAYPSNPTVQVLRNLDLTISEGICTAIVGSSGCGKSTLASLIMGLYGVESTESHLSIFGQDIQKIHPSTLRSMISLVPQNPVIFPTTIRNNITYGTSSPVQTENQTTLQTQIEQATQLAGIHEFIQTLPAGYSTILKSHESLSGGQAQRITIARAIFRRPRILILDEVTSALDPGNAALIRGNIARLMRQGWPGRERLSVVAITHSREMMKFADRVVVMEHGRVVEQGTYTGLMGQRGKLWKLLDQGVLV